MADYVDSAFLSAQTIVNGGYQEAEVRERLYPILQKGLTNAPYIVQNVNEIKESTKRAVKAYQFKRIAADNGTNWSHNFTGSQGDSMEIDLTWSIFTETFTTYMGAGDDNVFNDAQMLANHVKQKQRILRERLGKALLENLHAARTQVSAPSTAGYLRNATFDSDLDAFLISNQDRFFAYLKSVMEQHNYLGNVDVMVDSVLSPLAANIANQGSSNGSNLQWQLDGMSIMKTHALGAEVAGTAYPAGGVAIALPEYSFGYIPWIPAKYRNGSGSFDSYNGGFSTMPDDVFGDALQYTLRGYTERADGSSNGSTVDTLRTHWQIGIAVANPIADISTANETPIYEFALNA